MKIGKCYILKQSEFAYKFPLGNFKENLYHKVIVDKNNLLFILDKFSFMIPIYGGIKQEVFQVKFLTANGKIGYLFLTEEKYKEILKAI